MLMRSIYRNGLILGAFALVSIGLIALFHELTKDKIKAEMAAKLARTLHSIVPSEQYDNDVYHDCVSFNSQGSLFNKGKTNVYRMRKNNRPVALVFSTTAPDGYSGKITFFIGVYSDQSIAGVRVITHNETPGLGDKIEKRKSNWIDQFSGLSLTNPTSDQWKVKKDGGQFDSFTGATITPRATLSAIRRALIFAEKNSNLLFEAESQCGQQND